MLACYGLLWKGDELGSRAAEPVESPYDERVARPELIEDFGEFFAAVERPGCLVGEHPETAGCFEGVALETGVLERRHGQPI